jgi:hypothetical protein
MVKFSGMSGNTYHCEEYQIYGKENAFFLRFSECGHEWQKRPRTDVQVQGLRQAF